TADQVLERHKVSVRPPVERGLDRHHSGDRLRRRDQPMAAAAPDQAQGRARQWAGEDGMSTSLVLRNVSKVYGRDGRAVSDFSLDVAPGEFVTLLGPSGSGKTTVLKMIAGFETPTAGEIELGGESVVTLPPYRRGIGMVFQNYALFPHMTVFENVAFPLSV